MVSVLFLGLPLAVVRAEDTAFHTELRQRAQAYADTMIQYGRDFVGTTSPMFASALTRAATPVLLPDRRNTPPPHIAGIREFDRALDGGNVFHDQQLFQLLYGLSEITGQGSYSSAADTTLTWFFNGTQSSVTGLMPWGEHLGWDFRDEAAFSQEDVDGDYAYLTNQHEYTESWELWSKIHSLAATDAFQFAQGLWDNQMSNHSPTDLRFSRHKKYNVAGLNDDEDYNGGPPYDGGNEFPRHGGYYIDAWSEAYSRSTDSTMVTAVDSMVQSFLNRLNTETGALPMGTAAGNDTVYEALNNLELAIQLDRSRPRMPSAQATKMQELSNSIDGIFLSLGHELGLGGRGFVLEADANDLSSKVKWSSLWRTAYGLPTDAEMALLCFQRYKSLPSGAFRDAYRDLCLDVAARYLNAVPDAPDAPSDPIGSWLLNESSGTNAADASGNGRNGTLAGSPATPVWQPNGGHTAGGLQFDGIDDKVTVTGLTTQGLTAFTYAAWIFPTGAGLSGYGRVLSHEASNKDEFCMSVNTDDPNAPSFQAIICNTAGTQFKSVSAVELPLDTWSHFAVTYSDTGDRKLHLYLDGVEVTYSQQQTLTGTLRRGTNPLVIGNRPNLEQPFDGKIDEVKAFNRALSDGEIASLAGIALWPMALADVIDLLVGSFQITGDSAYVSAADIFAEQALDIFLPDRSTDPTVVSGTALPKASHLASHYETITGGDRLMFSLFKLSQQQGPIGKWLLDESSGTSAADATGNGNTGALAGSPAWQASGGHTAGALQFDGVDDKVTVTSLTPQADLPTAFTYAAWIYATGAGENGVGRVFAHEDTALGDLYMCLTSTGTVLETSLRNTATDQFASTSTTALSLNNWHHVAVTYNDAGDRKMHLYVNGVEVAYAQQIAVTGTLQRTTAPLVIGNRAAQDRTFAGKIDEFTVYNRALSASEIAALGGGAPSGPIGSWLLDESSGTSAADATGNGNTGALAGSPAWQASGGHTAGALQFDGVDDKVTVTSLTPQADLPTAFTYAAWIYATGAGENGVGRVFAHEDTALGDLYMCLTSTGTVLETSLRNTATDQFASTSTTALNLNNWHHVAVTYNDAGDRKMRLYVNGVEVTYAQQNTVTGTLQRTTAPLVIGNRAAQDRTFAGKIDEFKVFNRALSGSEIAALGGGAPSGPIGNWLLDESSGTSAADATGNGRTGTLAGGPAWQPSAGHTAGALQFDGVDDKVTVTSLTTQGLTTFTYAAWIYPTGWGLNGYGRVLSHEATNKDEFCMSVNTDATCVQAIICNTGGTQFKTVSATILPLNTWSHFAVTYSDTGDRALHLYLNGVEVTYSQQQTLTGTLRRGTNPLVIGNRPPQDQPFAGKVDEGRVYDRVLSTSEIAALAQ